MKPYNTIKEVIGYCDGVLTKGDRVIVPETLRKAALKQIHGAHLGVSKCLEYARTAVYWPGMTADITTTVQACESCQENAFQQPRESMRSYDVPPHPWHTLGIDNFELNGKLYLILVDYLSKFPVIRKVSSTSAKETISVLRQVFSEYGIPNKLICDRGTNFTSKDMREFAVKWNFSLVFTSSEHHQSHGQTERFVQTVKQVMKKCLQAGDDPLLALLILRCTPVSSSIDAPCLLLNRRMFKSSLFSLTALQNDVPDSTREKLQERKEDAAKYKPGVDKPELHVGDKVKYYMPRTSSWLTGYVTSKSGRDYTLQTEAGRYIHRNRKMVKLFHVPDPEPELYRKPDPEPVVDRQSRYVELPVRATVDAPTVQMPVLPGTPARTTVQSNTPARRNIPSAVQPVRQTAVRQPTVQRKSIRATHRPHKLDDYVCK